MLLFVVIAFVAGETTFGPVLSLPGQPLNASAQFAGLIQVNFSCPAFVFAWLAKADLPSNDVIVFLNGGPGSSSFLGWFFENVGPFSIQSDLTLTLNPYRWNRNADLVIFDQPFGVGLSLTSSNTTCLPQNTDQSSDQLANAIDWLFLSKQFGLTGKRLFLFGESYAGTWIPLLARKLLEKHPLINLSGLGMGDGWVSPVQQQATYSKFAALHGLINGPQIAQTQLLEKACVDAINAAPFPAPSHVNDICNEIEAYIANVSNVNVLDVRTTAEYDFTAIANYLNRASVFRALNLPQNPAEFPWSPDSDAIGNIFATGEQDSVASVVSGLLDFGLPTLIYNGVFDMDCNFFGTDVWLESCDFMQKRNFDLVPRVPYFLNNTQVGMFRVLLPVSQVVLSNAGHLVPFDVPAVAQSMVEQFVKHHMLQ